MIITVVPAAICFFVAFGAVVCAHPSVSMPDAGRAPRCEDVLTCVGSSEARVVAGLGVTAAITSTTPNAQKCYCYEQSEENVICTGYACDYSATFTIVVPGASSTAPYGMANHCTPNLVGGAFSGTLNPQSCGGSNYASYFFYAANNCVGNAIAEVFVTASCTSSQCQGWYCPAN